MTHFRGLRYYSFFILITVANITSKAHVRLSLIDVYEQKLKEGRARNEKFRKLKRHTITRFS